MYKELTQPRPGFSGLAALPQPLGVLGRREKGADRAPEQSLGCRGGLETLWASFKIRRTERLSLIGTSIAQLTQSKYTSSSLYAWCQMGLGGLRGIRPAPQRLLITEGEQAQ